MGSVSDVAHSIDARGLLCPIPVIRAQDLAKRLPQASVVRIVATDPGVLYDIPAWCRIHGHRVIACREDGEEIHIEFEVVS